jgi:cytochrome oxidase Cu insertion factor (SCO1/SenC/PrrC family)
VGRDVWLVSVSVDPTTDVPERLQRFAAKFDVGPAWTFVTGRKTDIDRCLPRSATAPAGPAITRPLF